MKADFMTDQQYRSLLNDYHAAARIVDAIRSDRQNFCLPPSERPSEEELESAEDRYAELGRIRRFQTKVLSEARVGANLTTGCFYV